jgi:hypothetical protein
MTDIQKQQLRDWLVNNLQLTSFSNIQHIIDHVDRYYCPSHSPEVLVKALENANKIVGYIKRNTEKLNNITLETYKIQILSHIEDYEGTVPQDFTSYVEGQGDERDTDEIWSAFAGLAISAKEKGVGLKEFISLGRSIGFKVTKKQ